MFPIPPPSMAHYDMFRDQLAIKYPAYGQALWEPYYPVEIGDVGCVLQGKFLRLFNALLPANHPSNKIFGVPESHEPLKPSIANHIESSTLRPEYICSPGVRVWEFTSRPYSGELMVGLGPEAFTNDLRCETKRGVALLLPSQSQREDTVAKGEFAEWMVKHIDRWFSFAKGGRHPRIGRMEDIILVTGRHRTKLWANVAFFECHSGFSRRFPMQVKLGDFGEVWTFNCGHGQGVTIKSVPNGKSLFKDECVFIRGFRVTRTHQALNWFRSPTSGLNQNLDNSKPNRQPISTTTIIPYQDPLSSLVEYIANKDPHSDMVLVHDDDLARFIEISPMSSLETLQRHEFLAHLQEVRPKIQRVLSGPLSANDGQRVAILSKGRQGGYSGTQIPSDQPAHVSGIWRNLRSFLSKVLRKNLSPTSQQVPQHDAPIHLSAYIAGVGYAPSLSSLDSASLTSDHVPGPAIQHPLMDMPANPPETTKPARNGVEAVV